MKPLFLLLLAPLAACSTPSTSPPLTGRYQADRDLFFRGVERSARLAYAWDHTPPPDRPANPAPPYWQVSSVPVSMPAILATDALRRDTQNFDMTLDLRRDHTFSLSTSYSLAGSNLASSTSGFWSQSGDTLTLQAPPAPSPSPTPAAPDANSPWSLTLCISPGALHSKSGSIATTTDRFCEMRFYKMPD